MPGPLRGAPNTYEKMDRFLGNRPSRRVNANKVIHRVGDSIHVKLYNTDIVKAHPDGTFTLGNGGWDTPTTRRHIEGHSPARISSRGLRFLRPHDLDQSNNGVLRPAEHPDWDGLHIDATGQPLTHTYHPNPAMKRSQPVPGLPLPHVTLGDLTGYYGGFNRVYRVYHATARDRNGRAVSAKINGRVKTWTRRPGEFRVPLSFGMYQRGGYLTHENMHEWHTSDPTEGRESVPTPSRRRTRTARTPVQSPRMTVAHPEAERERERIIQTVAALGGMPKYRDQIPNWDRLKDLEKNEVYPYFFGNHGESAKPFDRPKFVEWLNGIRNVVPDAFMTVDPSRTVDPHEPISHDLSQHPADVARAATARVMPDLPPSNGGVPQIHPLSADAAGASALRGLTAAARHREIAGHHANLRAAESDPVRVAQHETARRLHEAAANKREAEDREEWERSDARLPGYQRVSRLATRATMDATRPNTPSIEGVTDQLRNVAEAAWRFAMQGDHERAAIAHEEAAAIHGRNQGPNAHIPQADPHTHAMLLHRNAAQMHRDLFEESKPAVEEPFDISSLGEAPTHRPTFTGEGGFTPDIDPETGRPREYRRRYSSLLSKKRYAAPPMPPSQGPTPDPKRLRPEQFTVRSAKPLGGGKFALFHFVPARVEKRGGFGADRDVKHEWMWSYQHPPRVVDAAHLQKIGVEPKQGPRLFSLVPPELVEKLEGKKRGVFAPATIKTPAGRPGRTPPNTRFQRHRLAGEVYRPLLKR